MKRAFMVFAIAAGFGILFGSAQVSAKMPIEQLGTQPKMDHGLKPKLTPIVVGNPFVDDEAAYSASISMMPGNKARINWWAKLRSGVTFESLKTFGQLPLVDELPEELQPHAMAIAGDRILPWYVFKEGVWKRVPVITHCKAVGQQVVMCTQDAPVALTVDPTTAIVIQQLKTYFTSADSPHRIYFEDVNGNRSPQVLFVDLIANGQAQADEDKDGIYDAFDNCPAVSNPDQKDSNDDGEGDACIDFSYTPPPPPADSDGDGFPDDIDTCPDMDNYPNNEDSDADGVGDMCDACPDEAGVPENKGCPRDSLDVTGDGSIGSAGEGDVSAGAGQLDGGGACSLVQSAAHGSGMLLLALLGVASAVFRRRK